MPMKPGKSHEIITSNIHEMMQEGHPIKRAIAASLAYAHSNAGEPEYGNIGGGDDNADAGIPAYSKEDGTNQGLSPSTQDESDLVQGLQNKKYQANDNSVEYSAGDSSPTGMIKKEGLIVDKGMPLGNKPSMPMSGSTEAPMSEEMKSAIMAKKAKRRY